MLLFLIMVNFLKNGIHFQNCNVATQFAQVSTLKNALVHSKDNHDKIEIK